MIERRHEAGIMEWRADWETRADLVFLTSAETVAAA